MTTTVNLVVQLTAAENTAIAAKAKKMGLSIADLMRLAALAYESSEPEAHMEALAQQAKDAADRACAAIDDALESVASSEQRIDAKRTTEPTAKRIGVAKGLFDVPDIEQDLAIAHTLTGPASCARREITASIDVELYEQATSLAGSMSDDDLFREAIKVFVRAQIGKRLISMGGTLPDMDQLPRRRPPPEVED